MAATVSVQRSLELTLRVNGRPHRLWMDTPGNVRGDGLKDAFGSQRFTWHVTRPLGAGSTGATTTTPKFTYP